MTVKIAIPYHSGAGHTEKVASFISEGATAAGGEASLINILHITEADWATLDAADAIIFGAPTYMGSAPAEYKRFMDDTSKRWMDQRWKDKVAAGFTNSGVYCGDKLNVLQQFSIFAMQHSMIWVGTGLPSPIGKEEPTPNDINRLGSFLGLMTFATSDSTDVTPPTGDLQTAKLFGERVTAVTKAFTSA